MQEQEHLAVPEPEEEVHEDPSTPHFPGAMDLTLPNTGWSAPEEQESETVTAGECAVVGAIGSVRWFGRCTTEEVRGCL
jgi:hypothetical protein